MPQGISLTIEHKTAQELRKHRDPQVPVDISVEGYPCTLEAAQILEVNDDTIKITYKDGTRHYTMLIFYSSVHFRTSRTSR